MTTTTKQESGHTNSTEHTKHFYFVHEIQNKSHFHPEFSIGHTAKPDVAVATGITSREEADKIANSLNSHEALVEALRNAEARFIRIHCGEVSGVAAANVAKSGHEEIGFLLRSLVSLATQPA